MGGAGSADPLTLINFFINIILEAVLLFINSRLFSYQCLKVKQQTKLRKGRGGGGRKEKGWFNLKQIMKCHDHEAISLKSVWQSHVEIYSIAYFNWITK